MRERDCLRSVLDSLESPVNPGKLFARVFTQRLCQFSCLRWVYLGEIWAVLLKMWSSAFLVRVFSRERERERKESESSSSTVLLSGRQSQQWSESGQWRSSRRRDRERGGVRFCYPHTKHPLSLKSWQIKPKTRCLSLLPDLCIRINSFTRAETNWIFFAP